MDLQIGQLKLRSYIYNSSGVWDTTSKQLDQLYAYRHCGAIVSKSCTLDSRKGNDYPKYHFNSDGFSINSNGLENNGLDYYINFYKTNKLNWQQPFFISVGGLSDEERITMLKKIQALDNHNNLGVELNMSCPNLGCVGAAYDHKELDTALEKIFTECGKMKCTFGLKLPPYYLQRDFNNISAVLKKWAEHIDFITCINSVPNCIDYDINNDIPIILPNNGYGGMGGPAILPIGLANVSKFSTIFREQKIPIKIIGCGGIQTGADVYKYYLAGASAVQVGTHLWKNGPSVFETLTKEFRLILCRKGFLA